MKKMASVLIILATVAFAGCSGKFWSGVGGGALSAGAAYEVRADLEMDRIKDLLDKGEIDQREYDIRKDQIERMAIFQN